MIKKIGQIMLYVKNQEEAARFWTEKVGFVIISEENMNEMRWIEIAPTIDAETSIILHDKEAVAKMSPEVNLSTPSLMFMSDNLEEFRMNLLNADVTLGKVMEMPAGKVFNFADHEQNYFAVMEKAK